ncbi:MAG: hypothetical protein U0R19_21740 [Bryobacteraceae bacterium]
MMNQFLLGMAATAILFFSAIPARAGAIRMVPSSSSVFVGTPFDLDIVAENLNLGGFDFILGFNAGLVGVNGADPDLLLGDTALFEAFFNASFGLDTVQVSEVSLLSPAELLSLQGSSASNAFRLARFTVQANAPGVAEFTFSQMFLTDMEANQVEADLIPAQVILAAVEEPTPEPPPVDAPEPGTWMVGVGLGLIMLRRAAIGTVK